MRFRVVCGLGEMIASFSPTSALSKVDLPALGRPRMHTKPERNGIGDQLLASAKHLAISFIVCVGSSFVLPGDETQKRNCGNRLARGCLHINFNCWGCTALTRTRSTLRSVDSRTSMRR